MTEGPPKRSRPAGQGRAESNNNELGKRSQRAYITDVPGSLPEAALFYAKLGLPMVPLHSVRAGICSCGRSVYGDNGKLIHPSAGKHPRTLHGSKDATTDINQIIEWWGKRRRANIGNRMDGTNLIVLDVDPRNGGDVSLAELEKQYGRLPATLTVDTGGGGSHFYFTHDGEPLHSSKKLGPGLDLIGTGGCVVAPPSRHLSGELYRYREDCPNEPVPVPSWIVEIAQRDSRTPKTSSKKKIARSRNKSTKTGDSSGRMDGELSLETMLLGVAQGQRDETMFRYACSLQAKGLGKEEAKALITAAHAGVEEGTHPFTLEDALKKVEDVWERYEAPPRGHGGKKDTVPSRLIAIVQEQCELFHDGPDTFVSIEVDGHRETYPVGSTIFRRWLRAEYWRENKASPHSQGLQDAMSTLEALALFEGSERMVFLRVAESGGAIYVDLGDDEWRAVKITSTAWRVVRRPSVRFHRPSGYQSLPVPQRNGDLRALRPFVNVEDEDFVLILAFLVAALFPGRPCPILALNGEQGSAKSTLCRLLRALLDPNATPNRRPPRNSEDLMVSARHSRLLVFDNMSGIQDLSAFK